MTIGLVLALLAQVVFEQGNWTVTAEPDAISDRQEVQAVLRSDAGTLTFMCARGETSVLAIQPTGFLGGPISRYELRDTWVRLDDRPAQMNSWKYVGDYATPYSWSDTASLLSAMRTATRLTVRMTRYDRGTVDVTFDLAGADEALTAARARC